MGDDHRARARRPAHHHMDLADVRALLDQAWELAAKESCHHHNALRTEVALFSGLRGGELAGLTPSDIRDDGTIRVRAEVAKKDRPRTAAFINGLEDSNTLEELQAWIRGDVWAGNHRDRTQRFEPTENQGLWPTIHRSWAKWLHRCAERAGVQEEIETLNGSDRASWKVHPHALRAAFVMLCRRWPRLHGRDPIEWTTIRRLGGWKELDTVLDHYYAVDQDVALAEIRAKMGGDEDQLRGPRPEAVWSSWRD